jgi:hypothetical protein
MGALVLVLVTIITVVILWQGMKTGRTAIKAESTDAYRKLAENAVAAEQRLIAYQQNMAEAIDDIRLRLASLEKMLKEVG